MCAVGRVLLAGSGEGVVAASSVTSGLVVKVIQDHRGAPVTDLTVAGRPVQVREGLNEKVQACMPLFHRPSTLLCKDIACVVGKGKAWLQLYIYTR